MSATGSVLSATLVALLLALTLPVLALRELFLITSLVCHSWSLFILTTMILMLNSQAISAVLSPFSMSRSTTPVLLVTSPTASVTWTSPSTYILRTTLWTVLFLLALTTWLSSWKFTWPVMILKALSPLASPLLSTFLKFALTATLIWAAIIRDSPLMYYSSVATLTVKTVLMELPANAHHLLRFRAAVLTILRSTLVYEYVSELKIKYLCHILFISNH